MPTADPRNASQTRPRLLVVMPSISPPGGGESVAAWAIQAMRERFAVSVLSYSRPNLDALNHYFGTSLEHSDFEWIPAVSRRAAALEHLPVRLAYLRIRLLERVAWRHVERMRPDVVVSFNNEMNLGVPALQYVHFPALLEPRPDERSWFHLGPLVWIYRRSVGLFLPISRKRLRANTTLVNSTYVADLYERTHGVRPSVLHPPVSGGFDAIPWEQRENAFVCAGRIAPEKRIESIIRILVDVRRRGHDVGLHVFGAPDTRSYARRIEPLLERHRDWITLHGRVTREDFVREIPRYRYGIHGNEGEHFGIAVAEMQRAGCVVFAPNAGGPREILGEDARLLFDSPADAAAKIGRVLGDRGLQVQLQEEAAKRAERYTTTRFMEGLLAHVEAMASSQAQGRV